MTILPEVNLIKIGYLLLCSSLTIVSSLLNLFEKYLPTFITQTFRYGKFAYNGPKSRIKVIEVPKSWFKHFYIFSSAYSTLALLVALNVYLFGGAVPQGFVQLLDFSVGKTRQANVNTTRSLIALILLTLQCYRRLYETHCVSVFSSHARMNIMHYIVGYAHYAGAVGAILSEAPAFAKTEDLSMLSISNVRLLDVIGTVMFIWAWSHQFISAVILASLRKDHRGVVVSHEHRVPTGDWFEYVSSPHLLSEILMYIALTIILWGNSAWLFVLSWVVLNQVETALLSHWWYQETFKDYPKHRKAIIPFVY